MLGRQEPPFRCLSRLVGWRGPWRGSILGRLSSPCIVQHRHSSAMTGHALFLRRSFGSSTLVAVVLLKRIYTPPLPAMAPKRAHQAMKTMKRPAAAKPPLSAKELAELCVHYGCLKLEHEDKVKAIAKQLKEKSDEKRKLVSEKRAWQCKLNYYKRRLEATQARFREADLRER